MKAQTPSFYFKKLNPVAYEAMDRATDLCVKRTNPELEVAHWLFTLNDNDNNDCHKIATFFGMEKARLHADLVRALDSLPRGASRVSSLSKLLIDALELGWVTCSLGFGDNMLRTGHVLMALAKNNTLKTYLGGLSGEFRKINVDTLEQQFQTITDGSAESTAAKSAAGSEVEQAYHDTGKSALERFAVDLTERARNGEIDPVLCRDDEVRQIVDILMRRRQNNPLLVGEAGVGKTAVVEGFAIKLATGEVPDALKDVSLRCLDIGLLQAGASMKGEFEERLRNVIDEVQKSPQPIILFIDEAHTLIGAGGAEGVGDAANLLKPALARGTLRTIAATTWAEYKKHIEKDAALTRRFQPVKVEEPTETQCCLMLRGVVGVLEKHHQVEIRHAAVTAAVKLSSRYIPARQLPDKAISLLDTACARVALSQSAVPAAIERSREKIAHLEMELAILEREALAGRPNQEAMDHAASALAAEQAALPVVEGRWQEEKDLLTAILAARSAARDGSGNADAVVALEDQLAALQGDAPLMQTSVDEGAVAQIVADWTGVPVGRMVRNEIESVLNLAQRLTSRVVGQDHALEMIAKRVVTSRAGIDNPAKPIGVFMLAGTSGVGKTETALALAEALYGGESNLITINMSEFQEAHTVSTLKGAPPGYVGYGEGGVLTEAVRRRPYSVVLLDEVEKAHHDVHELFFQVFDKGSMEDGEGRRIDFKNTIILLTSNVGSDLIMSLCKDPELSPEPDALAEALRKPLLEVFPPALLGRLVTIPYYPLNDATMRMIIRLQLDRIRKRMETQKKIQFHYGDDIVDHILSRCKEAESGGRVVDAILTNSMLPDIGRSLLEALYRGDEVRQITVQLADGNFTYEFA
ncbi:MAG: type VI secretion system ATPase TssH [Verrucomicrobia bacterium]|nr:type VI secretion system ATPase TssH [Verrucomicrobiota bacterium]